MGVKHYRHEWQEAMNGVTIDCSLDIAVHPASSNVILVTVPGVDGTVDGYKNKYVTIAENVQWQHSAAVVRMSNPFITSFHWESNIRQVMKFIDQNIDNISGQSDYEIRVMAHSAGAAMIVQLAHEHPRISSLLLVNPAVSLGSDKIKTGLTNFKGKTTILLGSKDTSYIETKALSDEVTHPYLKLVTIKDADHHFSSRSLKLFIDASTKYLFG